MDPSSDDPAGTQEPAAPDPERMVLPEDVRAYFAEHPHVFPGMDVTVIIAGQKARRLRPDLSDEDFRLLFLDALERVSGHQASIVEEVLAYLAAVRPPPGALPPAVRPGAPELGEERARAELEQALALARRERARRWWPESWPTPSEVAEYRTQLESGWARGWPAHWPPRSQVEQAQQRLAWQERDPLTYKELAAAHDPPISARTLTRRLRRYPTLRSLLPHR